ncbi:hypothetical protein F4782DRAFT_549249 [Xylaria castorea]|nr:hypothetical protein F4782DRAFT_549249 [Xylaria castorea]
MVGKTKKSGKTNDVKHPKPFAYRTGDNVRPSLQPRAYRARELLNCTVASFYEISNSKLTSRQRQAKMDFIELFERQAKIPLKDLDDSDLDLCNTMVTLMKHLDDFFFFGSLTHGSPPFIRKFAVTNLPYDTAIGLCKIKLRNNGLPVCRIFIEKEQAALAQMVATLVHEMVHAFLGVFTCTCDKCVRNDINAVGLKLSGHGPIFRGMHYAVMLCMADWSAELDVVFRKDSNGTYVHTGSLSLEKSMLEDAKQSDALKEMAMLPYIKSPSNRLLIQTSEHSISVDVARLRANVRRTAASVNNKSVKPTTAKSHTKGGIPSTRAQILRMEPVPKFLNGSSSTDSEEQNRSAPLLDEDSEMDWSAEESIAEESIAEESIAEDSMCIYCTASACKLPIMKGEHRD